LPTGLAFGFRSGDSDPGDGFTDALITRFVAIDQPSTADENALWPIAAEDLGYTLPA